MQPGVVGGRSTRRDAPRLSHRQSHASRLGSFFKQPPTTEIYTLSLHDALPISRASARNAGWASPSNERRTRCRTACGDRKSTRLNSSHTVISYAVFCLKKKKDEEGTLHVPQSQGRGLRCDFSHVRHVAGDGRRA